MVKDQRRADTGAVSLTEGVATLLDPGDVFEHRHIGPSDTEVAEMVHQLGYTDLDQLTDDTVPAAIRLEEPLALTGLEGPPPGEFELIERLREIASRNRVARSCLGMGYSDVIVPSVIQRNILESPGTAPSTMRIDFPNE